MSGQNGEGTVTVKGGTVTTTAGSYATGIGGGRNCPDGTSVTINGGVVEAKKNSTNTTTGIGLGNDTNSNCTINLSWTTATKYYISVTSSSYKGTVNFKNKFVADDENATIYNADTSVDGTSINANVTLTFFGENAWETLASRIYYAADGSTLKLGYDCRADGSASGFDIASGKTLTIDLNGHTLDRNRIPGDHTQVIGYVFHNKGNLTIIDSKGGGVLKGGDHDDHGGAIQNMGGATLTITGVTIKNNTARSGGAIFNESGATAIINECTITDNKSDRYEGGAIVNKGTMIINGGTISNNAATSDATTLNGGGIFNEGTLTITDCSITNNKSVNNYHPESDGGNGGGIYCKSGSTLNISGNTVITGNKIGNQDNDVFLDKQNGNNAKITIIDELDENAKIGVRKHTPGDGVAITSGLSGKGTADNFISNYAGYNIVTSSDGEAYSVGPYAITVEETNHGTVKADKTSANPNETVNLTITPDEDYKVKSVSINGEVIQANNSVYSFTMPEQDVTVTAEFELDNGYGARLAGHSLSLKGDIGVNFYMELTDDIAESQTAYMHFTIPKDGEFDTKDVLVKDAETKTIGDTTYYIFECSVAAKEMDSNITATVIDGDDQSKTYTYSVRDYANYLLAHTDVEEYAEAAPLVRAMLTYGENAEYYFDKTGDEPADLDVNIPEFTRTVYDMPEGVTYSGATLSLKSETTLSIYFNSETEPTLTCTDQDITYETDKTDTNEYVIRIRGIAAYDLEKQFTVYVNGTKAVDYSPLRYCYMAQNSDDAKLSNTVKALYLYWFEAEKYFV